MTTGRLPVIQPSSSRAAGAGADVPMPFAKIGIIGLGLIGGSIALATRELWPASLVIAVDNKDVLEVAMRRYAIDVAADDPIVLAEADIVILAAPVRQNAALLEQLDEYVRTSAVITDVGSTKRDITAAAAGLPSRFTFIGGHPLAGAARSGLEHARSDLFRGRPWILTPAPTVAETPAFANLRQFVEALGAVPHTMTPEAHDRLLAALSHLPQIAASALMQVVGDHVGTEGLALAGRGLADTTRLASSPPDIWKDIAATNADEIGVVLEDLIEVLRDLQSDLASGERLTEVFDEAARWREAIRKD